MKNVEIRTACMEAGVKHWQLAAALGITETHFSKKLRNELPKDEKEKILEVLSQLVQERRGGI